MSFEALDEVPLGPQIEVRGFVNRLLAMGSQLVDGLDAAVERGIERVALALGGDQCDLVCLCDETVPVKPDVDRWDGERFWCESCWQGRVMYLAQSVIDSGARITRRQDSDGRFQYVISVREAA